MAFKKNYKYLIIDGLLLCILSPSVCQHIERLHGRWYPSIYKTDLLWSMCMIRRDRNRHDAGITCFFLISSLNSALTHKDHCHECNYNATELLGSY